MIKIQQVSRFFINLFNFLNVTIPLFIITNWFFIKQNNPSFKLANFFLSFEKGIETPEGYVFLNSVNWTLPSLSIGLTADLIAIIPFMLSIIILKKIFKNYQQGQVFTQQNALFYRNLGYLFFVDAILTSFSESLMILAVTFNNLPGHRFFSIGFGTPNLSQFFYGVLVIVLSWIMLEASKINDDQKFTI